MDFDNRKVYGDTSITDGLVFLEDHLINFAGLRMLFRCSSDVCKLRIDFDTMVLADPFSVSHDTAVIFAFYRCQGLWV